MLMDCLFFVHSNDAVFGIALDDSIWSIVGSLNRLVNIVVSYENTSTGGQALGMRTCRGGRVV